MNISQGIDWAAIDRMLIYRSDEWKQQGWVVGISKNVGQGHEEIM